MHILVRAVISGFGFSLGAALYKKVAKQLGLEENEPPPATAVQAGEPATSTAS